MKNWLIGVTLFACIGLAGCSKPEPAAVTVPGETEVMVTFGKCKAKCNNRVCPRGKVPICTVHEVHDSVGSRCTCTCVCGEI